MTPHPARFSDALMPEFQRIVDEYKERTTPDVDPLILDPFAGTGRIHELTGCSTYGIELEPEWAALHPRTDVGNATALPSGWDDMFDMVITSPTYGNRMADHHTPGPDDRSTRITYAHRLGRKPSEGSSAVLQWGEKYRDLHVRAWLEVQRVLIPGGWFVLNIRDHYRNGKVIEVSAWHLGTIRGMGFDVLAQHYIATPGMGFGANRELRVEGEHIFVFRKTNPTGDK